MAKVFVIGIGYRPLNNDAKEILYSSGIILTSARLNEVFKNYKEYEYLKNNVIVINNVDDTIEFIHKNYKTRKISALASGDPLFFGIGRRIINELGKEEVEVLPDLSSIQIAFAKIKEPWSDAFLMSLHGGPDPAKRRRLEYELEDIPSLLGKHKKIAILTDKINNPQTIAAALQSSIINHQSPIRMYVCEKLGYPDEKITEGTTDEINNMSFENPNVVIIMKIS